MDTKNINIENNDDVVFVDIIEMDSIDSEMLCNSLGCG